MLKIIFGKIAHGLLVGIGFGLALGAVLYVYSTWQLKEFESRVKSESFEVDSVFKKYTAEAGLLIVDHRPQREINNDAFLGALENKGTDTWESVKVVVEMFGKDGVFVDKCTSYTEGSIGPGQKCNFKVSCAGCRESNTPVAYDKYTVAIADAQYVRPNEKAGTH